MLSNKAKTCCHNNYTCCILNISDKSSRANQNTYFIFNIFLIENRAFYEIMWKILYSRAGQATDDSMAHSHCMLDNWGYRQTLRICKTYCLSTATMVARTHLSVTLYIHCLSCHHHHHHHHHVQERLGLIPVPCILKMKLVPPSLPRSSYVSSSFWFIL